MERYILAGFLQAAKMHKYFVLNTSGCERCELRTLACLEALDCFYQSDGANRDEILQILACVIEFFHNMCH
ncbi:hypothetical protein D3C80_2213820 [compost metagenome]